MLNTECSRQGCCDVAEIAPEMCCSAPNGECAPYNQLHLWDDPADFAAHFNIDPDRVTIHLMHLRGQINAAR